eukprot:COSAG06_NODE_10376_length_1692_cov_11.861268_2_plen_30_part_01
MVGGQDLKPLLRPPPLRPLAAAAAVGGAAL